MGLAVKNKANFYSAAQGEEFSETPRFGNEQVIVYKKQNNEKNINMK